MNHSPDPLVSRVRSDRLHYSTGELLGADDLRDEQTYHRRQLARALLHVHGSGTLAGLRVVHRHRPGADAAGDEVELEVRPGLALDHAGRLIEVPREACLRLRRWYEFIAGQPPGSSELNVGDLRTAWRADAAVAAGGVVVADVFLTFHECPRGYKPAFASGPFDALDASQPSRVRDSYELSVVLRTEADADLPVASDPWAAIAGATPADRLAAALETSLDLWERFTGLTITPGATPGSATTAALSPAQPAVTLRNLVTTGAADSIASVVTAFAGTTVLEARGSVPAGGPPLARVVVVPNPVLDAPPENPLGVDPTAVLLARLRLPARATAGATQPPDPDWSAGAWPARETNLNNGVRHVLLPPAALRRLPAP